MKSRIKIQVGHSNTKQLCAKGLSILSNSFESIRHIHTKIDSYDLNFVIVEIEYLSSVIWQWTAVGEINKSE